MENYTETRQPPRQAAPATPPQEGNCSVQKRGTTESCQSCLPATPPQEGNCSVQNHHNHPVRLRLPPLHRRGIAQCRTTTTTPSGCACHPSKGGELLSAEPPQPPRQAAPATPPKEGNCSVQNHHNHPVRLRLPPLQRRELLSAEPHNHPVRLRLPPLQRRGIAQCRTTRQPPRQAAPATPPKEGNCLVQNHHNHPVRLRLPPLHRRGIAQCRTTRQPPRQASPATPPQEGNCSVQNHHNHPVRLRLPPLHRRGIAQCRHHSQPSPVSCLPAAPLHRRGIAQCRTTTTTPSGCACHPSTGGELLSAEPPQPPRQAAPATPPQERIA